MEGAEIREGIEEIIKKSAVYLRPETAQAMFVQFLNCQQSMGIKIPFGIAQMGKSFRNEVTVEHFIFRSCGRVCCCLAHGTAVAHATAVGSKIHCNRQLQPSVQLLTSDLSLLGP